MAEQTSGESGSVGAGPAVPPSSEAQNEPVAAAAPESQELISADAPRLVPEQGGDTLQAGTPKADLPKADAPKAEAPKVEAGKADTPRTPGKIMIMSAGDRTWEGNGAGREPESEPNSAMFGEQLGK